jgi:hypothetical protein
MKNAIMQNYGPAKLLVALVSLGLWFLLTLFLSSQLFRWEPEAKIGRKAKLYVAGTAIPFLLLGIWEAKYGRVIAEENSTVQMLEAQDKSDKQHEDHANSQTQKPNPPPDHQ